MKKTVLIALAILGAGIASSQAGVGFSISFGNDHHRDRHYVPPAPCAPAPVVVEHHRPVVVHHDYVIDSHYGYRSHQTWGHAHRSSHHGDRHHAAPRHPSHGRPGNSHGHRGH